MALFARRVAHLIDVERVVGSAGDAVTYVISGELFFALNQEFIDALEYHDDPARITIDFAKAHIWDASSVAALDAVTERYLTHYGTVVEIAGMNRFSSAIHGRLSGELAGSH